jgi:8-oxo-dGTP diphosphatase
MANGKDGEAPALLLPVVAAALVNASCEVLVQRRPLDKAHGGLWEFPGGKIEAGESPVAALVRELAEELGIDVEPAAAMPVTFATTSAGERHVLLLLYLIRDWLGDPEPRAADALAWHRPRALYALAMPPADLPLVAALEARLAAEEAVIR